MLRKLGHVRQFKSLQVPRGTNRPRGTDRIGEETAPIEELKGRGMTIEEIRQKAWAFLLLRKEKQPSSTHFGLFVDQPGDMFMHYPSNKHPNWVVLFPKDCID